MEALRYSVDVLGDTNNILYLFPQGIIKPPNYRPIEFQTGLTYVAEKAAKKYGKVALMPVAVNYMFLREAYKKSSGEGRREPFCSLAAMIQKGKKCHFRGGYP